MQSGNRASELLSQAVAYLLGGIFLCTLVPSVLVLTVFGWVFVAFAFFLLIASCVDRLTAWANRVHMWLYGSLFAVGVASVIIAAVGTLESLYIVLACVFLLCLIGALLFLIIRWFCRR